MASPGQHCVAAAAGAARLRRHQPLQQHNNNSSNSNNNYTRNNNNKLISTATLTLLILCLSSCIAYATAAATSTEQPPTKSPDSGTLSDDFNSSSAFLGAIASAASSVNSSPIAIVSYPGITSSTPNGSSSTLVSMSDTPLLLDELAPGEEEFELPPLQSVIVSIILLIVILGTVVGNVLVCIAVCMVRKLRRPCNYLLVSLALSDLCVALLVMPMALLYEVLERWSFGTLLCDIWVSFDVLCCTASILNLCAISVDRYLAITKPLEYGVKRTPRRMMLCVGIVWLAAACISLPPLLILGNEHEDEDGQPICTVCQNFAYQIYATLGSFYIPLSVMLFVYYQIFKAARRIVLEEKRAQTHLQQAMNGTGSPQTATAPALPHTELGSGNGAGHGHRHSSIGNTSLTYSTCGGLSTSGGGCGGGGGGVGITHGHHGSGGGVSGSTGLLGSPHHKKLRFQLAKEKKASTTLGIIMSAFTVCWLPFFILALIRPFETMHVPPSLSSLFLWLGYANSLLNPIIYATLNRDFRKPFQEILYFRCSSLNTMMRENYYQDQYGEPPSQRVMLGDERHGARESFL
ncbi:5-hydroxytryptamine receptor 1 [Drosophila mojavensis]|uniref:G-protein coupled receptors family 1 profile domain-containing protein n=1 Tax=Drosophila mojavensis TaxID=7230 RepID=B4K6I6_DROMO|nr:5-hydroxytryptamine receptor 1 [Drosophila mojavensis]EDW16286.1 uncharacterized protein Dmoj_GI10445 [Drosophila mojavensis]